MTNSNSELEARLQDKFRAMCEAIGHSPALSTVRISPPAAEWETEYFLRGWNEGLFEIDSNGEVGSDLVRTTDENQRYRIFSREPPRLLRENLCQLAAAARLIFERGWLKHHLALEASGPGYRAPADGFDLLVRSTAGEILIWVEVKRSAAELEKLIADLRACSRRGPHSREDCGFPQNHPRHEFCLAHQPPYLWGLAPDGEISLAVRCKQNSIELELLSALPPRSVLEFR
jgi:hypothetical protein